MDSQNTCGIPNGVDVYLVGSQVTFCRTDWYFSDIEYLMASPDDFEKRDLKEIMHALQPVSMKAFATLQLASRWAAENGETHSRTYKKWKFFSYRL